MTLTRKSTVYKWGLTAVFVGALVIVFSLSAHRAAGQPKGGLTPQAYLPAVIVPPPFPEPPVSSVAALLQITPSGGINASTFNPGTFIVDNLAGCGAEITQVVIDLRTAVFMDLVYDPYGTAGDMVAKDVTIDSNAAVVGFTSHSYGSPHDDGFDVLTLNFNDFDPGERVTFSVDVDPTTIRGVPAPGPAESGSVSGLEMSGATITMSFSNSLVLTANALRIPGSASGSAALVRENLPPQPTVAIEGVAAPPADVSTASQTVQISGAVPWTTAVVVVVEGGLFTEGLPGGGFDIDPFEANSAIVVNEYRQLVNYDGAIDIPITLTMSGGDNTGLNHIMVYFEDYYDYPGLASETIVLRLTP